MNWSKKDNNINRKLIKEGKSSSEIISTIGKNKLKTHPRGRYGISNWTNFVVNEIKISPEETEYEIKIRKSKYYKNESNYECLFKTKNNNEYIIDFITVYDNTSPFNKRMFNISFTSKENHFLQDEEKYEELTYRSEIIDLLKRMIFIFKDIYKRELIFKSNVFIIGETKDERKISLYRNIIKDSTKDMDLSVKETKSKSFINKGDYVFYYEIL
jgi:hypothetical protein